jgi:thiosulfate dehydrogenase [quinone] large subunit
MIRALQNLQVQLTVDRVFGLSIVLMRILFGFGWLLAGVTKIVGKGWFSEPGIFLQNYLIDAMGKSNVPDFYKYLIEHVALNQVIFFNYAIPLVQIILGLFLITGFLTLPSILICLFMHVNFVLSGNMNLISLILYTSSFTLLLSGKRAYIFSFDRHFKLENLFSFRKEMPKNNHKPTQEAFFEAEIKKIIQEGTHETIRSVEEMQTIQYKRIEQLITSLEEKNLEQERQTKTISPLAIEIISR